MGIPLASISLLNVDFPTFTSINYMPQKVGVGGWVGGGGGGNPMITFIILQLEVLCKK